MMESNQNEKPILANRYQLIQTLGSGGMAVVYRAKDLTLERFVAVKVLRQDFSEDDSFRKRFHQEAKSAANLSHPNIVTVHDFGYDNDRLFIIMEFVPGTNLKNIIRERTKINIKDTLELMIQAASGVGYAHRAGFIHCDVKPHNMLVTPDQRVKVTDFGIARALASIQPDEKSQVVWGSPQYLSPEQAIGEPPSPASDVYSLGVVLYEMLTGKLPFYSKDTAELIRLHQEEIPVSPKIINPEIPEPLNQIVLKVLSKEPAARYRTGEQLSRVLQNILEQLKNPLQTDKTYFVSDSSKNDKAKQNYYQEYQPPEVAQKQTKLDWGTILLGLAAFLLAGGLIPFWLFIWLTLTNPK